MNDSSPNTIMLTTANMKAALEFYVGICGFEVEEAWPEGDEPIWANLILNGQSMMIGAPQDPNNMESSCASNPEEQAWHLVMAKEWQMGKPGIGALFYFQVEDVDSFYQRICSQGGRPATKPNTQFYGLRDFGIQDPTGYRLVFYTPVAMEKCQSCSMPLTDAKPGDMYCDYCTDGSGKLKPYEEVLKGTIQGYFMNMQKMERAEAEVAAKELLAKMPAWNACS